tara:strand:- start:296 stop:433 length:138 start_codon:yes stop_codon:yes gene_type:complete
MDYNIHDSKRMIKIFLIAFVSFFTLLANGKETGIRFYVDAYKPFA